MLYSAFNNPDKLFEICIMLHEIYWIKSKPDSSIMKLGPGDYFALNVRTYLVKVTKANACNS